MHADNLKAENLDRFHNAVYDSTEIDLPTESLVSAFDKNTWK